MGRPDSNAPEAPEPTQDTRASLDRIRRYYNAFDEWGRLDSAAGKLERLRTLRLIEGRFPPEGAILDLGGGPGRYTIELARRGFRPTLVDVSPILVETARRKITEAGLQAQVERIETISGVRLEGLPSAGFDGVLALGPFYHLIHGADRSELALEMRRVCKPAAPVCVAFLPRMSGLKGLLLRAANRPDQVPRGTLRQALLQGVFHNGAPAGFQEGWYGEPAEIRELFEAVGFTTRELVSVKSLGAGIEEALWRLKENAPELFDEALSVLDETAHRPDVVALGDHALWIGSA